MDSTDAFSQDFANTEISDFVRFNVILRNSVSSNIFIQMSIINLIPIITQLGMNYKTKDTFGSFIKNILR